MDVPITSKLTAYTYAQAVGGLFITVIITGSLIYRGTHPKSAEEPPVMLACVLVCLILAFVYFYGFLEVFKRVTVMPDKILIKYYITKKQLDITFGEITEIGAYRLKGEGGLPGAVNSEDLVIKFCDGKSITLNEAQIENYSELKSAIYRYKWGK